MIFRSIQEGYQRLKQAFGSASSLLGDPLRALFRKGEGEAQLLERIEELLYEADFGVAMATELSQKLRGGLEAASIKSSAAEQQWLDRLQTLLMAELSQQEAALRQPPAGAPLIIALVGVNGHGKTTSCAKLAHHLRQQGKKVLLCGADTYRAAAMEQIERWAHLLQLELVKGRKGSDAAAVAFDAATAACHRHSDVLIVDTAGRLQTKSPLMEELQKLQRSLAKAVPQAPHETLLVIDATQGQNGVDQARTFHRYLPLTGLILTKMDGTAKGGIVFAIQRELGIPVKFIGIGEGIEDLYPFEADRFCKALLS